MRRLMLVLTAAALGLCHEHVDGTDDNAGACGEGRQSARPDGMED